MAKRHLGRDLAFIGDLNRGGPVVRLSEDESVPECERIVLAATMDGAVVRRENFPRLREAMLGYCKAYEDPGHYADQANAIDEAFSDESVEAVCWNQTSVNANPWWVYDGCDKCGSTEMDEGRPYDFGRDEQNRHYVFGYAEEVTA
jgi:hypothetical protein